MAQKPQANVRFITAEEVGPRSWGKEILIAHAPQKYIGKLLEMKKGGAGNLQRHHFKDETSYVLIGEYEFTYDPGDGTLVTKVLGPGDCVHIPPGAVHKGVALTDCTIVEFSTPHFNDRVQMEKEYGLPESDGLPSTTIDEVELR